MDITNKISLSKTVNVKEYQILPSDEEYLLKSCCQATSEIIKHLQLSNQAK